MLTHKQTPTAFARSFVTRELPHAQLDGTGALAIEPDELRAMIAGAIVAFNHPDNQRQENLSEACARLGVNLHWKARREIERLGERDQLAIFFGLSVPLSTHSHTEPAIIELENLREQYPHVHTWVEAVL